MRPYNYFVLELVEINDMVCGRVANYADRILLVAVNGYTTAIKVLDALESDITNELCATKNDHRRLLRDSRGEWKRMVYTGY
jgi:hypothetical protein